MKTHDFKISAGFARREYLPVAVSAVVLIETSKAFYLYGHGSLTVAVGHGFCCRCGRTLTHPGSIKLGIGPECLGNWNMRDDVLKNMSLEEIAATRRKIQTQRRIDGWVPKSCVKDLGESAEIVEVPADHPRLRKPNAVSSVTVQGDRLAVRFPYDPKKVAAVREISGRRWDPDNKIWTVPANAASAQKLSQMGFVVPQIEAPKEAPKEAPLNLDGFGRELMPFQQTGVDFIARQNGRVLIADEMGLGKTVQALAYLYARPDLYPALVICPASLKLNWEKEAKAANFKGRIHIVSGKKPARLPKAELYIVNYDIVSARINDLLALGCKVMILDESHYLKNKKALRTKAVLGGYRQNTPNLSKIPRIIALTGTPIVNRPIEIYPVAKMIAPHVLPPFMTFARRYCGARHNGFGWDYTGATNTQELHKLLTDSFMIRRTKADVLTDLPDKRRSVIPMSMTKAARSEYKKARDHFLGWLRSVDPAKVSAAQRAEVLVQFQALKQLARRGKWEDTMNWIKDAAETNGKLIVFAVHHEAIDLLMDGLEGFNPVKIDGRDAQEARQAAVERFQNDPTCRIFIGNIKAAGVGLTLTAADTVIFTELGWTPGELSQAEDRAHRIGQKNAVSVYYLVASGTVEEEIAGLLSRKQRVLDSVLDGKDSDGSALLSELLERYTRDAKGSEIVTK